MRVVNLSRRAALKGLAGLTLAPVLGCRSEPPDEAPTFAWGLAPTVDGEGLGPFVRVAPDGVVTVRLPSTEMGQAISTALAMLVVEELRVPWESVRAEAAPNHAVYRRATPMGAQQVTGSSLSIRSFYEPMRLAGATARVLLVQAAAARWGVATAGCLAEDGQVRHTESGRGLGYGELAADAALLPVPSDVPLEPAGSFDVVGTDPPRLDTAAKSTGEAVYGTDVHRPGQRYASLVQAPFGGRVEGVEEGKARAMPGVLDVLTFDTFVAVVAENSWQALKAIEQLEVTWDEGEDDDLDDAAIRQAITSALEEPGRTHHVAGGGEPVLAEVSLEADYFVPYLDQAGLEPLCCTAEVTADSVELWAPTQTQTKAQREASRVTGVPIDRVQVHTTLVGGGFGRRVEWDFTNQAALVAQRFGGPVQLLWSRPEVFAHGAYRPAVGARLSATVDGEGFPSAVAVRVAGSNLVRHFLPRLMAWIPPAEKVMVEGFDTWPYRTAERHISYRHVDLPVPTGFMRSAGLGHNAFFRECFLDELAHAAGADPVAYRLAMLTEAPRCARLVERVAEMASWAEPAEGRALGFAMQESYGSIVAMVASVVVSDGGIDVRDVFATVDCGVAVHPDNVRYQVEGGIAFGLSSTLSTQINIRGKRVVQTNYHQYPIVRMAQMPRVHIELMSSPEEPIGGVGEIGVSPVAPAVANAVFAATGKRIRELPLLPQMA